MEAELRRTGRSLDAVGLSSLLKFEIQIVVAFFFGKETKFSSTAFVKLFSHVSYVSMLPFPTGVVALSSVSLVSSFSIFVFTFNYGCLLKLIAKYTKMVAAFYSKN